MRLGAVDALVNTNEFFVHHEDVRRARPDWAPRELDEGLVDALWAALGRMARMTLRRAGVGVVLDSDSDRRARIIDRQPTVEIRGPVGELVMFCNGRQDHARVELDGPTDAVARLSGANLGI